MSSRLLLPAAPAPRTRPRFLSEADCQDIAHRLARYASGGGETAVHLVSRWRGTLRWARNEITGSGEDRDNHVTITRLLHGASSYNAVTINTVNDDALCAAMHRTEWLLTSDRERADADVTTRPGSPFRFPDEPVSVPQLFFDATYQLTAEQRSTTARQLMQAAATAGMLSAGTIEVSATSVAWITSWGYTRYYPYTWARYSNTVRDPKGTGSGWAGVDWPDWSKIDGVKLSAIALEKCLTSRNPVAIEPGRYETILEPQAVCDFLSSWWTNGNAASRQAAETDPKWWLNKVPPSPPLGHEPDGQARFGERVIDARLTIRTDPLDPELGFPPFNLHTRDIWGDVYHPATWFERGVLKQLPESRDFAITWLGRDTGMPASGAWRMDVDGPMASIDEMIATTRRGLLVTRFDQVQAPEPGYAMLCRGYTRDGLWLVEQGKISRAVKNLMFQESIIAVLNRVEQAGIPQRCFHPVPGGWEAFIDPQPIVAPALKIRDFSFTALANGI